MMPEDVAGAALGTVDYYRGRELFLEFVAAFFEFAALFRFVETQVNSLASSNKGAEELPFS